MVTLQPDPYLLAPPPASIRTTVRGSRARQTPRTSTSPPWPKLFLARSRVHPWVASGVTIPTFVWCSCLAVRVVAPAQQLLTPCTSENIAGA